MTDKSEMVRAIENAPEGSSVVVVVAGPVSHILLRSDHFDDETMAGAIWVGYGEGKNDALIEMGLRAPRPVLP